MTNNSFDDFGSTNSDIKTGYKRGKAGGGDWHAGLTMVTLLLTAAICFGAELLPCFRENARNPFVIGLLFMIPAVTVFTGAILTEATTGAMTPHYSRKSQVAVALIAAIVCFLIGCLGAYFTKNRAGDNELEYAFLIMRDNSDSITETSERKLTDVRSRILENIPDGTYVGSMNFATDGSVSVEIEKLDENQRQRIRGTMTEWRGGTDLEKILTDAASVIGASAIPDGMFTRVVLLSDGDDQQLTDAAVERILRVAEANRMELWVVQPESTQVSPILDRILTETGGKRLVSDNIEQLTVNLKQWNANGTTADILHEAQGRGNTVRGYDQSFAVFLMLILEGLTIGLALWLMLSQEHQKRFQTILSPLCGLGAAFLITIPFTADGFNYYEALAFTVFGIVLMQKNR